jgi:hypothetical protein
MQTLNLPYVGSGANVLIIRNKVRQLHGLALSETDLLALVSPLLFVLPLEP